ncbi:NitT/TauT family transport system permease protein OS=Ureibacillus acetophenoni OX=614649 GN=SAMN05877842_10861 PE=3 SV=1 [Ureibacillus acetophenoni]
MKLKHLAPAFIGFILLIIFWQLIVVIGNYEAALFPPPLQVGEAIIELFAEGTIWSHIQISLFRFFVGYLVAVVIAIILGLILGRMTKIWSIIDPIAQVLRPVSPIAWSPFIVLWFGIGDMPAIVIIFIAAFFPVLLSTVAAVNKVDKVYLRVGANFELSRSQLLTRIVFPASFPIIANGLRMAIGSAWIFLVAGEMVGAQSGLGYLIIDSRNSLSLDVVLACIIFIGILGFILDKAIRMFENWVSRVWGGNVSV